MIESLCIAIDFQGFFFKKSPKGLVTNINGKTCNEQIEY